MQFRSVRKRARLSEGGSIILGQADRCPLVAAIASVRIEGDSSGTQYCDTWMPLVAVVRLCTGRLVAAANASALKSAAVSAYCLAMFVMDTTSIAGRRTSASGGGTDSRNSTPTAASARRPVSIREEQPAREPAALKVVAQQREPDQNPSLPASRRNWSRTFASGSCPMYLPPTITSLAAIAGCVKVGAATRVARARAAMSVFMASLHPIAPTDRRALAEGSMSLANSCGDEADHTTVCFQNNSE